MTTHLTHLKPIPEYANTPMTDSVRVDSSDMIDSMNAASHVMGHADHREFESLVERTKRQAFNMAYRMTGNRDDADDLTQEAYLRAYRSFDKYDRALPFENWFFRILSNLFVDKLRRKPKQTPLSLDQSLTNADGDDDFTLEVPDEASNPETQLLKDVLNEKLQNALAALPRDFRTAVLLCDVEGLSYEEIAKAMNTSIGTVRSRIHRGRLMLRKHMEGTPTRTRRRLPAALKPCSQC